MSAARGYSEDAPELTVEAVLKRDIPWDTYLSARLISDRDLQLIRRYDKRAPNTQTTLLEEDGPAYMEAFLTVLRNVTKEETVQYTLALLDSALAADPRRAALVHQPSTLHLAASPDPYTILLRLLQRTDWFTQEVACRLLSTVLDARPDKGQAPAGGAATGSNGASSSSAPVVSAAGDGVEHTMATLIDWLCSQLRRPSHPQRSVPVALAALARLLKERPARALFQRAGGVQLLAPLLRGSAGGGADPQLLYDTGLCVWQLTYWPPAAEAMGGAGVVGGLVEAARSAAKEKVVRVALAALRNLLAAPGLDLGPEAVELGLPKVVAQRRLQQWEDPDINANLEWLEAKLSEDIQLLSSFDKYRKEVLSGSLDWTPMHTSDAFWRDNAAHFEERDFQVLRVLLKLLEASREPRTLAVACSDLGRFISAHPNGRQIVVELRGKELVMRQMLHPEPEVQKQALLCVQKIMLARDKLEYLNAA